MRNLTVENVYTRQAAKELTKKHFWKLLGMMLIVFGIVYTLAFGGIYLLALATGAPVETTVSSYSYSARIDLATAGAGFTIGYAVLMAVIALVGSGLGMGLVSAMIDLCRGKEAVKVSRVFSRMRYCLKGFGLGMWVSFKTMLWALPAYALIGFIGFGIAVAGDPEAAQLTETTSALMALLPVLALVIIFALVIPAMYRYILSTYILADEPSTGVFECVRKSKAMMKGHKWQCFKLPIPYLLAMYGWMFAILIVLMVAFGIAGEENVAVIVIVGIVALIALLVLMLIYTIRAAMAQCLFYLKRKGDKAPIPPEEEERIVAWQPAAEKTASESVATDAANIGCWNPGGEVKPEKE